VTSVRPAAISATSIGRRIGGPASAGGRRGGQNTRIAGATSSMPSRSLMNHSGQRIGPNSHAIEAPAAQATTADRMSTRIDRRLPRRKRGAEDVTSSAPTSGSTALARP
jgi:hypothetical protein